MGCSSLRKSDCVSNVKCKWEERCKSLSGKRGRPLKTDKARGRLSLNNSAIVIWPASRAWRFAKSWFAEHYHRSPDMKQDIHLLRSIQSMFLRNVPVQEIRDQVSSYGHGYVWKGSSNDNSNFNNFMLPLPPNKTNSKTNSNNNNDNFILPMPPISHKVK